MVKTVLLALGLAIGASNLSINVAAAGDPLAEVDGVAISAEEVDQSLSAQLTKLTEQIYDLRRQKTEALINERLVAKEANKRGISVQAVLDQEVTSKVRLVTEQEIDSFYQTNRGQLKGEEANLRQQIRVHLQNQKLAHERQAFLQSLRGRSKAVVLLQPPAPIRAQIAVNGTLSKGPETAPVTVVEFTDFHCPFCKNVQATLNQVISRYGEKVRVVYKDYPIDSLHPQARQAHEAARCAAEQAKFWAYHDALYAKAPVRPEQLRIQAQEIGLDVAAFDSCLASRKYQAAVDKDIEEGNSVGLTGTPAFFINGRPLSGAQSFESFARLIDDELARGQIGKP